MRLILIILFLFFNCQSSNDELPILSYKINNKGLKEIYTITYTDFVNQDNKAFKTLDLEGKIVIANFFFTSCPSICPPMRRELIKVANDFLNKQEVLFVSHTIDAKNDTVNVLKAYSNSTGIPYKKWQFLRASEHTTKQLASQYMTSFKPKEDGTDFYHSSYVALLDKDQRIRGFYNILINEEVERLKTDITTLSP
jgi:protein SCO1/2